MATFQGLLPTGWVFKVQPTSHWPIINQSTLKIWFTAIQNFLFSSLEHEQRKMHDLNSEKKTNSSLVKFNYLWQPRC